MNATYAALGWDSLLTACTGAVFFPGSRIAGIIALITWGVVIIAGRTRQMRDELLPNETAIGCAYWFTT
jgi:hypothetical protein